MNLHVDFLKYLDTFHLMEDSDGAAVKSLDLEVNIPV